MSIFFPKYFIVSSAVIKIIANISELLKVKILVFFFNSTNISLMFLTHSPNLLL